MITTDVGLMTIEELLNKIKVEPSKQQMEMILHRGTPLNGLSCAGSGKTTTMITKVLAMEFIEGINPAKILMVTFSKAGADEMKARHERECGVLGQKSRVEIRTFHSTYLYLLKKYYRKINILDENERARAVNNLCRKHIKRYNEETFDNFSSLLGYNINNMLFSKNEIINTPKFLTSNIDWEDYERVCEQYIAFKEEREAMDFDDLQVKCYDLLINDSRALEETRDLWDYYIVDEFQDVSKLQLEILKLLVREPNNLITIGDDDQCIYEWRGSSINYIIDMPIHFPGTRRIIMDTNYRCPSSILEQIVPSIRKNIKRVDKEMKSDKENGDIKIVYTTGLKDCSEFIAEDIYNSDSFHARLKDIAILYRNHSQAMFVIDMLLRRNIPIQIKNASGILYNHPLVNDYKDIVLFAKNQYNAALFKQVALKIINYLNVSDMNKVVGMMSRENISWYDALYSIKGVSLEFDDVKEKLNFIDQMTEQNEPMSKFIPIITELYTRRRDFMVEKLGFSGKELNDIVEYLTAITVEDTFEKFYKFVGIAKSLISTYNKIDNAVKIMTMHTCKGLEFERVYILNDSEDHCPSETIESNILKKFGEVEAERYIEQERRLHYVAWTRAKKELVITVDKGRPSRFLLETESLSGGKKSKIETVYYNLY